MTLNNSPAVKKNLFELIAVPKKTQGSNKSSKSTPLVQEGLAPLELLSSHLFTEFPLQDTVQLALKQMGYETATAIQAQSLAHSLTGKDMLCLSETGSGKTLSFLLPIVNSLSKEPRAKTFAMILAPTRQLCLQIDDYLSRFRLSGLKNATSAVLCGGIDPMEQVIALSKRPAIIIGTPGRLLDHLQNTKGFDVTALKYLILDQADKLLNKDFELQFDQILKLLPQQRTAFLYSATLTRKIQLLQRVSLRNPVRIEVSHRYRTVAQLLQYYVFIPCKYKDCYLVHLLHKIQGRTIVFMKTRLGAERICAVLRKLNFSAECLHGEMTQPQRVIALDRFKADTARILVTTDVAARGIDVQDVCLVLNYDLCDPKSYVHRVGRTARIGHEGTAISIVTQYDVEEYQKIQEKIGMKLPEYSVDSKEAYVFLDKLDEVHRQVSQQMRQKQLGRKIAAE